MSKQMILRMPSYYKKFRCTADKCSDSCCRGWEIDIDEKTYEFYKTVKGIFGRKLRESICEMSVPHFILDKNERCPFLNDRNLCEIYINLGEDRLCGICTEHPRFFEWYNGVKEGGIGLCCEAAAEIIITQKKPFSYYDTQVDYDSCNEYDDSFYNYLFKIRDKIIFHLQNESIPFLNRLNNILYYAENMQSRYDNFDYDIYEIKDVRISSEALWAADILSEFSSLDILGKTNLFKEAYEKYSSAPLQKNFFASEPETIKAFENIAVYFVWRHFLKSVYEDEFYSKIAFSVLCTALIAILCMSDGQMFLTDKIINKSVYFSKEIEYNEGNLNRIFDNFYEKDEFSISKISSLLKIFSNF